jgi:hypothetical protein
MVPVCATSRAILPVPCRDPPPIPRCSTRHQLMKKFFDAVPRKEEIPPSRTIRTTQLSATHADASHLARALLDGLISGIADRGNRGPADKAARARDLWAVIAACEPQDAIQTNAKVRETVEAAQRVLDSAKRPPAPKVAEAPRRDTSLTPPRAVQPDGMDVSARAEAYGRLNGTHTSVFALNAASDPRYAKPLISGEGSRSDHASAPALTGSA